MAKIYFACSMRGGFSNLPQEELGKIPDIIESLGHTLMTKHNVSPTFEDDEKDQTDKDIHDQDYTWLLECEALVAEISNPSLGVGGEISDAVHLGKPILLIHQKGLENPVSAYTRGKADSIYCKNVFFREYSEVSEIADIVNEFISKIQIRKTMIKSGAIMINDKKQLLIVQKKGSDLCISPGGKLEGTETNEQALKRELKEELNVELESAKYFKTFSSNKPGHDKDKSIVIHAYLTDWNGDITPSNEISNAIWVNYEESKEYNITDILQKIIIELKEKKMIE